MVTGIGIDLIETARIERALTRRPALAQRLFTERELAYCRDRARPAMHLAARFAAKEAVIKALALTGGLALTEIEVLSGAPPTVRLSGSARERAGRSRLSLSLTHTAEMASAVVVAEAG